MNQWYVVKTKPKKEEEVGKRLQRVSSDVFLPKIRTLTSPKPLFPSYLFVQGDFDNPGLHRMIKFTRGIHQILGDCEGPQPISEGIIRTLRERTRDGSLIEQELLFKEGDLVRIKKGILKELAGIIEKNVPSSGRVKVLFRWLSGTARAVVKYTEIEKIETLH